MAIKNYKSMTPGTRNKRSVDYSELSIDKPNKSLTKVLNKSSGRNNYGKLTVRHKGGGVKRKFRMIDFCRDTESKGKVVSIEYDPNRSAFISLVKYTNGDQRYILSPKGIKIGDIVMSGKDSDINIGNSLPLSSIPVGSLIHNIEIHPNRGAQLVRSAGTYALLMSKSSSYATVKLPSGEIRLIHIKCKATYGKLSNESHNNIRLGKAGVSRKLNIRPTVRGAAMNPCDHKHGGGEGKAPVGLKEPRSKYGKKVNVKTRKKRKRTKHLIKARKG